MTSLTRVLQNARLTLRYGSVGSILRRVGITSLARRAYVKRVLREGDLNANVLGANLTFKIEHATEITRVDTIERERDFLKRIIEAVSSGDTVFDVGANVGTVSLLLAKLAPGAKIEAFEPEPQNASRLRENIALNSVGNVRVHETALALTSGSLELYVHGVTGTGSHSLVATPDDKEVVVVSTIRGEEFVKNSEIKPNVMKIDVEGAELDVLRGFGPALSDPSLHDLFIEVHPPKLAVLGASAQDIHDLLTNFGFNLVWSNVRGNEEHRHYARKNAGSS